MRQKPAFDGPFLRRAEAAIAHGALTNSKRPQSFVKGVYPTHLTRGQGSYVWDLAGNRYIDFICGLGSNLLGYAQDEIAQAISGQARLGTTLSLGTDLEVQAAEKVKNFFPFIERLRFLKTGSDATTAACVIARAGNPKSRIILSEGYHGWHPEFTSLTPPARGVTSHIFIEHLRSIDQVSRHVAAVIVEPVMTDISEERVRWLRDLRARCTEMGAYLIFDEVITGLRFPGFSVSSHYGVIPDLICLGKAIGGGLPLSIVGGRADLMDEDYFVSSTFAGETLSLAALVKTLELLTGGKFRIEHLWDRGALFLTRFNEATSSVVQLEGYPTRSRFTGDADKRALFFQESARAGILFGPSLFFNFPHTELMDEVLSTVSDIALRIKTGSVVLQGEAPAIPYAEKVRRNG